MGWSLSPGGGEETNVSRSHGIALLRGEEAVGLVVGIWKKWGIGEKNHPNLTHAVSWGDPNPTPQTPLTPTVNDLLGNG